MAMAKVAYEDCGCQKAATGEEWDRRVVECFKAMGSQDVAADMQAASVYLAQAKQGGIDPGIAAAVGWATINHAHPVVGVALPGVAAETPAAKDYYSVHHGGRKVRYTGYGEAKKDADAHGGYVEFAAGEHAGQRVPDDLPEDDAPGTRADLSRIVTKALVSHADVRKAPWRVTLLDAKGVEVSEGKSDSVLEAFDKAADAAHKKGMSVPVYLRSGFREKYSVLPPASMMHGAYFGEWPAKDLDEAAAEKGGKKKTKMKLGISGETAEDCVGVHTHTPPTQPVAVAVVPAAGEAGPEYAGEDAGGKKRKPRKLHWHRTDDEGGYEAEGHLGQYVISKRAPDRRHGVLPVVLKLDGKEIGQFNTKGEAQDIAAGYDFVMPYAGRGETDVRIEDKKVLVKGARIIEGCLPWVRITKDPERFSACLATAQKIGAIDSGEKVYELLAPYLQACDQEVFLVVLLDIKDMVRGVAEIARGQRSKVYVDPADVLRPVIVTGANSFWVAHNHPSSDATPSGADRRLTNAIAKAAKVAVPDVAFDGHVIIGGEKSAGQWGDASTGKVHRV